MTPAVTAGLHPAIHAVVQAHLLTLSRWRCRTPCPVPHHSPPGTARMAGSSPAMTAFYGDFI